MRESRSDEEKDETEDDEQDEEPLELYDDNMQLSRLQAGHIDYKKMCQYHTDCILAPKANSECCLIHHRLILHWMSTIPDKNSVRRLDKQYVKDFKEYGSDANVSLLCPSQPHQSEAVDAVRSMHHIDSAFEVWTVGIEFGTLSGARVVPYALCIRNATSGELAFHSAQTGFRKW